MQRLSGVLVAAWIFLLAFAPSVQAHSLKLTGVKVQFNQNRTLVSVVAHLHNFKAANPATDIPRRLKLSINDEPFVPSQPHLIRDPANGVVIWQAEQKQKRISQATPPQVAIEAPLFPEIPGDSTVVTVFHNRRVFAEAVVDAAQPSARLGNTKESPSTLSVALRFVHEGIIHIFGGLDHVLFLASLLLLGGTLRQILKIVTAFTLAHSITLSLAATGVLALSPRLVEPVIALSIVVVALFNIWRPRSPKSEKPLDIRPWMAFGFGLIHGFGFAGALAEVEFPRESLAWVLLSFNIGVEVGQVILVLLFAPTLAAITNNWPRLQRPIVRYGSATVAAMGAFWFIQRVFTA